MKQFRTLTLLITILILALAAGCTKQLKDPLNWDIESFTFTDQNHKAFGTKNLQNKVWVADFIFTSCTTVCPPMTANMARLQNMLTKEGITDVEFVSFSVDPTVDTPEKLKEFIGKYDMNATKWHFLTGYSQEKISSFAQKNFKTLVNKPASTDQVVHGTSLYVIDKSGHVVKSYSAVQNTPYEEIIKDIKTIR
ncbi:SCO family protein [Ectobacillus panaciterrae]|uniref:SCO family protein n=1 Tax=Ectobacillus panaciterrae TaxID=363872 RepID=UPI0003FDF23F|nr:SCO family protein [Ectobacillus panaciterrae]